MQVIKLVYIAHGWHLAIYDVPLVDDYVQAWQYGPVIPPLYYAFKRFGSGPITTIPTEDFSVIQAQTLQLLLLPTSNFLERRLKNLTRL